MDKTGTLTKGEFAVSKVVFCADDEKSSVSERELLMIAALAESYSTHPIAKSLIY
ncbi:MAG: hypothetical protein KBT19_02835 [Lachnospiraceae bacterium]|nr:hypothetical protein [Candidatus Colinaster equi]